ncbi:MAG: DNA polymerase I [Deltaproteobacteria bacterium]|nr:DNA polymerase I [Deltaproteobacteria bacterium]
MARTLYLVDGSNHAFRLFHAMPRLTVGDRPTGALLGFANLLRALLREERPDHLAVVFDTGPSFRINLYPAYKGHRPDMPPELAQQWTVLPDLVRAWGVTCLGTPGWEADDVIGTLARRHAGPDTHVLIVSNDQDFAQLVDDHIHILEWKGAERRRLGPDEVEERLGVPPGRVVDLLALWGDASDNVPGVPGVGEKKATALVRAHGGLEAILSHAASIPGRLGESLSAFAEQARLCRDLVTIRTDVPEDLLPATLDDLAPKGPDVPVLRDLFLRLQFRQHLADLDSAHAGAASVGLDRDRYRTVRTLEALDEALGACRAAGRFAFDTETTSLDPLVARLVGFSLCWSANDAVYVPIGHLEGEQVPRKTALARLGPLLADPGVGTFGQNVKFDLQVLQTAGLGLAGIDGDTLLADYLLEPDREGRKLDDLSLRILGHRMIPFAEATQGVPPGAGFEAVDLDTATRYAAEDAHVAFLVERILVSRLCDEGLDRLYREVELPVIPVLASMERHGIRLDAGALQAFGEELKTRIAKKEAEIHEMAGHTFNVQSTQQLAVVLYDEQGLQPLKKTSKGRSTDAQTLETLLDSGNPLPAAVLAFRSLSKLLNTYVEALPGTIHPLDGRIHTSFHQAVAATGRLASMEPNLQNIPIRTHEGRRIRAAFVPEAGHLFVSADYSQIELRVLADACGEGPLLEAFLQGEDVHRRTAAELFGVVPAWVTSEQRRAAKAVNFGIVYGMGAFRLANDLGIPRRHAQRIIDAYFQRYPQVRRYMDTTVEKARRDGVVTTRYGRRRRVPDLHASKRHVREAAERVAINTPIQGTAADIMKIAMVRVWNRMRREHPEARLLLQVHDELLLEVPEASVEPVRRAVAEEMEGAATLAVPLVVATAVGRTWEEAHEA